MSSDEADGGLQEAGLSYCSVHTRHAAKTVKHILNQRIGRIWDDSHLCLYSHDGP